MAQKGGGMQEKEALRLLRRLLLSVEALHGSGIVGLDIRPGSIWMLDGEITLGEQVSIAGALADTTVLQNLLATELSSERGYLPPEGPGTVDADLYALGAVLSFLVTGWHPIAGVEHDPLAVNPDLSTSFVAVIRKAMAPSAVGRYTSAEQLREDFEALSYDFACPIACRTIACRTGLVVALGRHSDGENGNCRVVVRAGL